MQMKRACHKWRKKRCIEDQLRSYPYNHYGIARSFFQGYFMKNDNTSDLAYKSEEY